MAIYGGCQGNCQSVHGTDVWFPNKNKNSKFLHLEFYLGFWRKDDSNKKKEEKVLKSEL